MATLPERMSAVEVEVKHANTSITDVKTTQTRIEGKIDTIHSTLSEQLGAAKLKKEQMGLLAVITSMVSAVVSYLTTASINQ